MSDGEPAKFRRKQRAPVSLLPQDLVSERPLLGGPTPLLMTPAIDGVNLLSWVVNNREAVRTKLLEHAALLFRGFALKDIDEFEQILQAIGGDLLQYSYASTPRSHVAGRIYTSTEYPANQEIPLHNEMAYSLKWPMKLGFYSVTSAPQGGETPLADSRRVFALIPPEIRDRFMQKKVMYVRNYGDGLDLPWQKVFQTDDRMAVEEFCRQSGIDCEWKPGGGLRTTQICQSVATHPSTGETVWFNQAHLFHVSSLPEEVSETLLASLGEDGLPRNCYYGDGSRIDAADLETIRRLYREQSISFPWQDGDIVILENMLVAHGRRPFSGPRRLVVGMAEPSSEQDK
ncbi:MAG: putative taurine catabolism dioxygenase [Actinomycetia bacterium]|nr:putative taurine catabolism dioxygenase [Actinomycetes bacterium]